MGFATFLHTSYENSIVCSKRLHKKYENMELQQTIRMFSKKKQQEREGGRGEESKNSKERERSEWSKAGPYTAPISLTPEWTNKSIKPYIIKSINQ